MYSNPSIGLRRRSRGPAKIILVIDSQNHSDWPEILKEIKSKIKDGIELEVWNDEELFSRFHKTYGLRIDSITDQNIAELRMAVDKANGKYAFGDQWSEDPLQFSLLWHLGYWRLGQLIEKYNLDSRSLMPPGLYKNVAVLLADLSSFSSYVRDTRDDEVVGDCLTSFYSKARY